MADPVDIAEPLAEILRRLSLTPEDVGCLIVEPTTTTAVVFRRRDGVKYLGVDGEPATDTQVYEVRTM
jgi:hypothetical protein